MAGYGNLFLFLSSTQIPTTLWVKVCSTNDTHLWKTGSAYGKKPERKAVATEDKHSNSGKRSLSSSFSWFHFWIRGGINILINSGLLRWWPTESASVPIASYSIRRFLCYKRREERFNITAFFMKRKETVKSEAKGGLVKKNNSRRWNTFQFNYCSQGCMDTLCKYCTVQSHLK